MSIRALKLRHDVGWVPSIFPIAVMSFDIISIPWTIIATFIGFGLMIAASVISSKMPEARLNAELIQSETREYYKNYPLRPIATGFVTLFGLALPFI
ncbi:hypothetical protein [Bosea sp. Root483D1]|uniref:hypothetical protein n=1 Tax=Bosea sp. Root483D1 TaxID=1736544 RepID=UPI0012E372F5|nr:hypothetical protein [Bosea sp. Root483D1]